MKKILSFVFIALALVGCANLNDAKNAKGTGNVQMINAGYDKVWVATKASIVESGLYIVKEDKSTGEILATKGVSMLSYGENIAVFVRARGGLTEVEIVSKKVLATNVFAPDWSQQLFPIIKSKL
jgi:hypothetical protein